MTERQPVGPKLRFEVFKRDKFTCMYCGAKAPEAVLHVDHIHPVAEGGTSDILNLITSCRACNGGKGARLLSDDTIVEKQRQQIEELEERRQQLEMMLQWRDETRNLTSYELKAVVDRIGDRTGLVPVPAGEETLRRLIRKYGVAEVLEATDSAFDQHLEWTGDKVDPKSWSRAFGKIGAFLTVRAAAKNKEHLPRLLYIQGILRKRLDDRWLKCIEALDALVTRGAPIGMLEDWARQADDWDVYHDAVHCYLEGQGL